MTISTINYQGLLDGAYGLVLTANSVEKAAVAAVLGDTAKADIGLAHQGAALAFAGGHILLHVTGGPGGTEETSVGYLARQVPQGPRPRPAFVILTGICWGNPARVAGGDVIVATTVASINHQREEVAGRSYRRSDKVSSLACPDGLLMEIAVSKGHAIHPGVLGSAELYLAADAPRDALLAQHPDLLGGEMEAFAFLSDLGAIPWIVVKGVSDDAGDATDKAGQRIAAERAAAGLPQPGLVPAPAATPARGALVDAIIGDAIAVGRPDDLARLNDHLNNEIGPQLEHRLARYVSDDGAQAGLQRALMILLLEIIQNALRHGNAGRATLTFYETRIELIDDGEPYAVDRLAGDRGGGLAWAEFQARFLAAGLAELSYKVGPKGRGNHYGFKINRLTAMLRTARAECSVTIQAGAIGAPGGMVPVFSYDPRCEVIHVSTAGIRMYSRSRFVVDAIIDELGKGKTVYLACVDTHDMRIHERLLEDHLGPSLRIYVAGRAGV